MRTRVLLRLVVACGLAGLLLAALMLPVFLIPGVTVTSVNHLIAAQATVALDAPLVGNTRVLAADGSLITEFYENNRTVVTSEQIAPVMKKAIVDIEDARFYRHGALDAKGIVRAFVTNARADGGPQGASTITQQLVKQTLFQNATTEAEQQAAVAHTLARKLVEARYAIDVEKQFSKDEILTRYLNTVYFGQGAYGIQAAAQAYFSTDAAHLDTAQAATLAGLVQNPTADDPVGYPEAAQERRNEVLTSMHRLGHLSTEELRTSSAQPITLTPGRAPDGCANATIGGFFCDYLQQYLTGTLGLSQDQIDNGGLTIRTTLRPDMQRAGDQSVVMTLAMDSPLAGIYTVVEPGTGQVLAMSQNRTFGCTGGAGCSSVNLNIAAAAGSGSTYKLFTAAEALQRGATVDFRQTTSDPYASRVYKQNGGPIGAPYVVRNAGRYPSTMNMAQALVMSSNTYFVALEDHLGSVEGPIRLAQQMGLTSLTDDIAQQFISDNFGSFTLGPIATSPLALANAYATVFSGGLRCDPTPVTGILDAAGKPLTDANGAPIDLGKRCEPVLSPAVANTLTQVLRGDVESTIGTGQRANIPGHEIAGKTGTSENNYSVAFVGSTPEYTASVMVENPDTNQDVGGFGGGKGAQIWHDAMLPILSAQPTKEFPPADRQYLGGLATTGSACTFRVGNLQLPC